MAAEVIDLGGKRPPVVYTVSICQGWDGSLSVEVHDLQDDPRSRHAVADAMRRAADQLVSKLS